MEVSFPPELVWYWRIYAHSLNEIINVKKTLHIASSYNYLIVYTFVPCWEQRNYLLKFFYTALSLSLSHSNCCDFLISLALRAFSICPRAVKPFFFFIHFFYYSQGKNRNEEEKYHIGRHISARVELRQLVWSDTITLCLPEPQISFLVGFFMINYNVMGNKDESKEALSYCLIIK